MRLSVPRYGYSKDEDGLFVPNHHERYLLNLIQKLHRVGAKPQFIATTLNSQGFVNRQGRPWTRFGIIRLIERDRFAALCLPGDAEREVTEIQERRSLNESNWWTRSEPV